MSITRPNASELDTRVELSQESLLQFGSQNLIEILAVTLSKNPFWWHPDSFESDSESMMLDVSVHQEKPAEGKPKIRSRKMDYKGHGRKKMVEFDIFLKLKEVCKIVIQIFNTRFIEIYIVK